MNSSAVNARIKATAEAIRRPVAMYGTELGRVTRYRRSRGPTPNDRAVSIATGSTSRTPYIVWISSGQNAPKAARKISLLMFVPSVRKSSGINAADGIGRRNSIGTLNALPAKSLEPSRMPIGTASTVARPRPRAQPRTVRPSAAQNSCVCIIDHSSRNVVVIAGRSCSEITPNLETACHSARNAAIEAAAATPGVRRVTIPPPGADTR